MATKQSTAQSQHSHSTATARSQHGHNMATKQSTAHGACGGWCAAEKAASHGPKIKRRSCRTCWWRLSRFVSWVGWPRYAGGCIATRGGDHCGSYAQLAVAGGGRRSILPACAAMD